jgi:hypothetical protein
LPSAFCLLPSASCLFPHHNTYSATPTKTSPTATRIPLAKSQAD